MYVYSYVVELHNDGQNTIILPLDCVLFQICRFPSFKSTPECRTVNVIGFLNWRPSGSNLTIGATIKLSRSGGWSFFGKTIDTDTNSSLGIALWGICRLTPKSSSSRTASSAVTVLDTMHIHAENSEKTSSFIKASRISITRWNKSGSCSSSASANRPIHFGSLISSKVSINRSTAWVRPWAVSILSTSREASSHRTSFAILVGARSRCISVWNLRITARHKSSIFGKPKYDRNLKKKK